MDTERNEKIIENYRNVLFKKTIAIEKAIEYAHRYGQIGGAHHRLWVIDQMVRALLECPVLEETATDSGGIPFKYTYQGESFKYNKLIKDYEYKSDDGHYEKEKIYEWDLGVAP